MKVLDLAVERLPAGDRTNEREPIDLTRCTRCGGHWGFDLVEKIEIWECGRCGYEARERPADFRRTLIAQQEALTR